MVIWGVVYYCFTHIIPNILTCQDFYYDLTICRGQVICVVGSTRNFGYQLCLHLQFGSSKVTTKGDELGHFLTKKPYASPEKHGFVSKISYPQNPRVDHHFPYHTINGYIYIDYKFWRRKMYTVPHSWNSARIFQAAADTSSVQPASSSRLINYPSVYIQRGVMETPRQCLVQSTNCLSDKQTFQHEGFRTPSWITQRILMKVVVVGSDSP